MRHFLFWTAGAAAACLLLAAGLVAFLLWGSLPETGGQIQVHGPDARVEIVRDRWGIPHIRAESVPEAYFGLGFVHAQDRLWQMELRRRAGQGRLAEVVGSAALPFDRLMRTLGLYQRAVDSVVQLAPDDRRNLEAYAAGVNAFLNARPGPLPPEFQLLWHSPEPWQIADSLVFTRLMSLDLGLNWRRELLRARLARKLTAEQVADLFPAPPADTPVTIRQLRAALGELDLERLVEVLPPEPPPGLGSNIWAVSGSRTRSGAPLLANDPHLGLDLPGVWYLASLEAPGLAVVGGTMPSMPIVVAGRNRSFGWGLTNTGPDTQDLFIERVDPDDAARYVTPTGSEPFTLRPETIRVRGGEDVRLNVRETRHGPVVSDLYADGSSLGGQGTVLALAWTALDSGDVTLAAGFGLARAATENDVEATLRAFGSPQQNVVWANRDGRIGLLAPGHLPIRRSGDGLLPVPGWDGQHDWIGRVPYEGLPRTIDPGSGQIVNANNRLADESYPYLITSEWEPDRRARRIEVLLGNQNDLTVQDFAAMQRDLRSTLADQFLPYLLDDAVGLDRRDLLDALRAWDRRMPGDRPEPLAFSAWYAELGRAIYADELGEELFSAYGWDRGDFLLKVLRERPAWCDDVGTPAAETCAQRIRWAWDRGVGRAIDRFGTDWRGWRWDQAQRVVMRHEPLQHFPIVGRLFEIDVPGQGDSSTVNVAHYRPSAGAALFETVAGPSYRMILDFADLDRSLFVAPTGQSGHPLSRHWRDLTDLWTRNDYVPMRTEPDGSDHDRLILLPDAEPSSVNR
jgi:penicillin amidase